MRLNPPPPRALRRASPAQRQTLLAFSLPQMLWKIKPPGALAANRFNLGGDVRQHAALGRDIEFIDNAVDGIRTRVRFSTSSVTGLTSDHRIPAPKESPS